MSAGIVAYSTYLPAYVLSHNSFTATPEGGAVAGRGVAAFDQDPTTLAVEAGLSIAGLIDPAAPLIVATATPPYVGKSIAATVHAALDLDEAVPAVDVAALRGGASALGLALRTGGAAILADVRTAAVGAPDELRIGDAAVAFACAGGPVAAELLATASATIEVLDRWRQPGDRFDTAWDERFTATIWTEQMLGVAHRVLDSAGVGTPDQVVVACPNARAATAVRRKLGGDGADAALERLTGHTGAAHVGLLLAATLEKAAPGQRILVVHAADGADAWLLRTTEAIAEARRGPAIADQLAARQPLPYERYLRWRELLTVDAPRRPAPVPPAAPPAQRHRRWKFGLVAARCPLCNTVAAPPTPRCPACGAGEPPQPHPIAHRCGTVVSAVADHLAFSVETPVLRAVIDVDGGGRCALEVADPGPEGIGVGDRVRPTFRRVYTSGGIHNYFWKARRLPAGGEDAVSA